MSNKQSHRHNKLDLEIQESKVEAMKTLRKTLQESWAEAVNRALLKKRLRVTDVASSSYLLLGESSVKAWCQGIRLPSFPSALVAAFVLGKLDLRVFHAGTKIGRIVIETNLSEFLNRITRSWQGGKR